jgi:hypothetical protein
VDAKQKKQIIRHPAVAGNGDTLIFAGTGQGGFKGGWPHPTSHE